MSRQVLLDTNMIIGFYDRESNTSEKQKKIIKEQMIELLEDDETTFHITPLIRYEVLRAKKESSKIDSELVAIMNEFTEISIDRKISDIAVELFRRDRQSKNCPENPNINKHSFDIFHFATAKAHDLELIAQDKKLNSLKSMDEEHRR